MSPLLLTLACAAPDPTPPGRPTDTEDSAVACTEPWRDWSNTGHPLLLTWCTGCHAAPVQGEARRGAPEGVDLDTPAGARLWADRLLARIQAGTMPPGGGMPAADIAALEAWLACGGPGADSALAATSAHEDSALAVAAVVSPALEESPEGWLRMRRSAEVGEREGVLLDELYTVDTEGAAFAGWALYDSAGVLVWERRFDPPVPLGPEPVVPSWTTEVQTWDSAGEVLDTWTWELLQGPAEELDAHERGSGPWEVLATASSGETHLWHLDEQFGIVAREVHRAEGGRWIGLQMEATQPSYWGDSAFPLDPTWGWVELGLAEDLLP